MVLKTSTSYRFRWNHGGLDRTIAVIHFDPSGNETDAGNAIAESSELTVYYVDITFDEEGLWHIIYADSVDGTEHELYVYVDDTLATLLGRVTAVVATEAKQDIIDTVVDAIKAKTDNLPGDPADASDIATAHGLLATEVKQDIIDGIVDSILVDTGTTLPATLEDIKQKATNPAWNQDTDSQEAIAEAVAVIDGLVDAIKAVTDALPNAGALNDLASIKAKTDNLPGDPADASDIATAHGLLATEAKQDTMDTVVDAIKAKTDNLPGDPADASVLAAAHGLLATESKQDTIDGVVDAILVDTDATIPGLIAALNNLAVHDVFDHNIQEHTSANSLGKLLNDVEDDVTAILEDTATTIPGALTTIDTVVDAIKAKTDNLPTDPADASDIATAHGLLATEAKQDIIDTVVDAVKAETDKLTDFIDKVMKYLGDGDGVGWGGTPLPANTSLYDVVAVLSFLAGTGTPTVNSFMDYIMSIDGDQNYDRATDSLEALRDGLTAVESAIRGIGGDDLKDVMDAIAGIGALTASTVHVKWGYADVGMTPSQTVIVSDEFAGNWEDNDFNTGWRMFIWKNASSHGSAPEGEYKDIIDYVDVTGTFTTAEFSANVEENDKIIIYLADTESQANYDKLAARIFAGLDYVFATTSETASQDTEKDLAAPAAETIDFPADSDKVQIKVLASIKVTNKTAAAHHIDLTLQRRYDAGAWTDLLTIANNHLSLPAVDGTSDEYTATVDITDIIAATGKTIEFRFQVNSSDDGLVHYKQIFVIYTKWKTTAA